jgi:hypothetical protein
MFFIRDLDIIQFSRSTFIILLSLHSPERFPCFPAFRPFLVFLLFAPFPNFPDPSFPSALFFLDALIISFLAPAPSLVLVRNAHDIL